MRSRENLAWAAGLFEGEGSFSLNRTGDNLRCQAAVAMTDEDTVVRFRDILGVGKVYGPYGPYAGSKKVFWRWHVYSAEHVQAVAAMLWPWLGDRRRTRATEVLQARRVWELAARVGLGGDIVKTTTTVTQ